MSNDAFAGRAAHAAGPIDAVRPVTPSDAADLPGGVARGLFVGEAGTVAIVDRHGGAATLTSMEAQYHPIRVLRVRTTGTTATGIVALY